MNPKHESSTGSRTLLDTRKNSSEGIPSVEFLRDLFKFSAELKIVFAAIQLAAPEKSK